MDRPQNEISAEEISSLLETMDEDAPDFYAELRQCAWTVVCENPGCFFDKWTQTLMAEYPGELVDALGIDPEDAMDSLRDMWESGEFEDTETGVRHVLKDWAEILSPND